MKNKILTRNVYRPLLIAALAAASTLAVVAQPRPADVSKGKDNRASPPRHNAPAARPAPAPARGPSGFAEVRFGNDRYYTHRGMFYRSGPRGYVVVRPPIGLRIAALPLGFARIYINNMLYFRYNNIYYRPVTGGYVVVDLPVATTTVATPAPSVTVVNTTTPAPAVATASNVNDNDYQALWVNGIEYRFKDGQFFQKTADGLVWVEPLLGAVIPKLPADATSVWYQEIEYFDCDSVYFRKTPDGYKVVEAPWKQET